MRMNCSYSQEPRSCTQPPGAALNPQDPQELHSTPRTPRSCTQPPGAALNPQELHSTPRSCNQPPGAAINPQELHSTPRTPRSCTQPPGPPGAAHSTPRSCNQPPGPPGAALNPLMALLLHMWYSSVPSEAVYRWFTYMRMHTHTYT